jgi:acyl-homoserine-lactone acylase
VEARGILGKWDDRAATASRGADLFAAWWAEYTKSASQLYSQKWSRSSPLTTPSGIGDTASALKALSTAAQRLKSELGTLDVAWGDTHRFRRGTIDLPLGGTTQNLGAFRAVLYAKDKDGKWRGAAGDTYTLAVEFADSPVAYSVLPYSESSDPASPHFNDQGPLFATSRYKRVVFSEDDIRKSAPQAYSPPAEKR